MTITITHIQSLKVWLKSIAYCTVVEMQHFFLGGCFFLTAHRVYTAACTLYAICYNDQPNARAQWHAVYVGCLVMSTHCCELYMYMLAMR